MPIKKTPNESRTKNAFSGTVPGAGRGTGGVARQASRLRRLVSLRGFNQKTGFSPQYSKSDNFQPKSSLYNFPTLSITSYNINLYHRLKICDQFVILQLNDPNDTNKYELATCIV